MVSADLWAKQRYTPIWLQVRDPNWKPNQGVKDALSSLQNEDPHRSVFFGEDVFVPLRLPMGGKEEVEKKV